MGLYPLCCFSYIPSGFALVNHTQGTNPYTVEPHGITTTCVFTHTEFQELMCKCISIEFQRKTESLVVCGMAVLSQT